MTNYPAKVDTTVSLPTVVDNSTPVSGVTVNRLRDAILAIEEELGVKPSGLYTTVRGRLDNIELNILGNLQIIELAGDLGNTLANPYVIGIWGRPISNVAPQLDNVLTWDGIAWVPSPAPSGGSSGFAGGDLSGTYPSPSVVKIQGNSVANTVLGSTQDGYLLTWTNASSQWQAKPPPVSFSAGGDLVGTNTLQNLISISKLNVVTLEKYGAVGDGVTNDSAAMTAALAAVASGGTIQLGSNKTYLVSASAPYNVPAGVTIVGYGDSSIIKTTANTAVFIPSGDHTTFRNFRILGSGAIASSQIGIANQNLGAGFNTGFHWMRIEGITFDTLGGAGVLTYQITPPSPTVTPYFTALITNCRCWECGTGLWLLGEYSTVTGIQIDGCGIGIECEGGNQVYVGGTITACGTGFKLDGGGNDAHGVVSGMEINHNTTNIFVWNNEANGEKFVDCMIYSGDILLQSTHAVQFIGCQIDVNNYYFDGSVGTVFDNCTFPQSAGTNTIHNNYNGHASTTRWASNNVDLNGNYPSFIVSGFDGTLWNHNFDGYILASTMAGFGAGFAAVDNTGRLTFSATTNPGGAAGGDLSGTYPSPSVVALRGKTLSSSLSTIGTTQDGYVLTWVNSNSDWEAQPPPHRPLAFAGFSPFVTANTTFTNAATFDFDPTTEPTIGSNRRIKLIVIAETTAPLMTIQLYNFTTASVVTGNPLFTTTSTSATEFVSFDLTPYLTNGKAIYQVQIKMAAGSPGDQVTLDYARLEIDYS